MNELIEKTLKPLYKHHLYEAIISRRRTTEWVYSHMEDEYVEKYWHHIGLARITYLAIKILKRNNACL